MKPGKWERRAKWVAYFQVTWTGLMLLANTLLMIGACYFTLESYREDAQATEKDHLRGVVAYRWRLVWDMWTQGSANTASAAVILWMSFWLIKGTKQGQNKMEAYRLCRNWRNASIAGIILVVLLKLGGMGKDTMMDANMWLAISSIMWGVPFLIVCMYMRELKVRI